MAKIHTHYETLKVARDAPDSVINAARKALSQTYHPDKFQDDKEKAQAEEIIKQIHEAYSVLIDPVKRAEYDAELEAETSELEVDIPPIVDKVKPKDKPQHARGVSPLNRKKRFSLVLVAILLVIIPSLSVILNSYSHLAEPPIRSVDFRNFTYKNFFDESVTLKDGKFVKPDNAIEETVLNSVQYADFDNDGTEEAVVSIGTTIDGSMAYAEKYLVYAYQQGQIKEIFSTGRRQPNEMKVESNSIIIKAPYWKEDDSLSHPSQIETAIYDWREGKIQLLSHSFVANEEPQKNQEQQEQEVAADSIYPICGSGDIKDYTSNKTTITDREKHDAIIQRIGTGCTPEKYDIVAVSAHPDTKEMILITNISCNLKGEGWFVALYYNKKDPDNLCAMIEGEYIKVSAFDSQTKSFSEETIPMELKQFAVMDYTPQATNTEAPIPESNPSTLQATSNAKTWLSNWGNDIIALVSSEKNCESEFSNQGYPYFMLVTIPAERLKRESDAWLFQENRAVTIKGCWTWKDQENKIAHAIMTRKKDFKTWEQDLKLNDGSWIVQ